jgi:hypothetical protein
VQYTLVHNLTLYGEIPAGSSDEKMKKMQKGLYL